MRATSQALSHRCIPSHAGKVPFCGRPMPSDALLPDALLAQAKATCRNLESRCLTPLWEVAIGCQEHLCLPTFTALFCRWAEGRPVLSRPVAPAGCSNRAPKPPRGLRVCRICCFRGMPSSSQSSQVPDEKRTRRRRQERISDGRWPRWPSLRPETACVIPRPGKDPLLQVAG